MHMPARRRGGGQLMPGIDPSDSCSAPDDGESCRDATSDGCTEIDLSIEDERWLAIEAIGQRIEEAVHAVATHEGLSPHFPCGISIALLSDARQQQLNAAFRGKNAPTNVLSFPAATGAPVADGTARPLGDISLALETVLGESKSEHKTPTAHVQHLVVHGVLHLLGYDHQSDDEAEEMERLEVEILQRLGIANPYRELLPEPDERSHTARP